MTSPRFLVVSLGNPQPYYDTLHSAGHWALNALQQHLAPAQPPFASHRFGQSRARASLGDKYLLVQCPTLMNVSGPWVAKIWKHSVTQYPSGLGLVLVHDDLEQRLGAAKWKPWTKSAAGQNGVKSVQNFLRRPDYKDYEGPEWARMLVGIGRPEARDRDTVSDYVLRSMTTEQKQLLGTDIGSIILRELSLLEQRESPKSG